MTPAAQSPDASRNVRLVRNRKAAARGAPLTGPLTVHGFDAAYGEISGWPDYAPTPLRDLPALAGALKLGAIHYKDESGRFGLSSFKPLGAAYAAARAIVRVLAARGETVTARDLLAGRARQSVRDVVLVSATDGNHGRAVAWGATLFGARAKIFSHDQMSEARRAAIKALGAELIICEGGYDDSVRAAFAEGAATGAPVIQDTSVGDYRDVPIDICHGDGVIAKEAIQSLGAPPTHAIVQAGVGGVASAIAAAFWHHYGAERPRFIVLEPTNAACVAASLDAGHRVTLTGDCHTAMAGLACGEVSEIAWEVLVHAADAALVIDDAFAFDGMRRLADPLAGDPSIVAGECAGGAIGALMAIGSRPDIRAALDLDDTSRVFVLGTEGATDPDIYRAVVGRAPTC